MLGLNVNSQSLEQKLTCQCDEIDHSSLVLLFVDIKSSKLLFMDACGIRDARRAPHG